MLRFSEVGYRALGFDIDPAKTDKLNAGESYIEHIRASAIAAALAQGFQATTDFSRARDCDALILCVPTPLNKYREPDLSFVIVTTEAILPHLCLVRSSHWKAPPGPAPPRKNCARAWNRLA